MRAGPAIGGGRSSRFHPLWDRDAAIFPELPPPTATVRDHDYALRLLECQSLLQRHKNGEDVWSQIRFIHFPKAGGSSVREYLKRVHLGHHGMRMQRADRQIKYMTTVRHPVERMLSWYHFLKNDNRTNRDIIRKHKHFCKNGTGSGYRRACNATLSPYEFMMQDHNYVEEAWIHSKGGPGLAGLGEQRRETLELEKRLPPTSPLGTTASLMVEFLSPAAGASLSRVKKFIISKFALVGDATMLPLYLLMVETLRAKNLTRAMEYITSREHHATNVGRHSSVRETLGDAEYFAVVQRHRLDMELYYWWVQQIKAITECFDHYTEGAFRRLLCPRFGMACSDDAKG